MAKASYIVKSPIDFDGERHEVDAVVDIDDKIAKSLLEAQAIEPAPVVGEKKSPAPKK